ncbi:Netrin receptor unc-5 [Fasciola gigantica]|uniref:Netrin receptor UNC5 n=1 Tax=Fasciola gigantica TaxID=46835 RepID=A0A504YR65_FASGI|nr:Netrin receptor unc-5 [Fasciola gigantica]
MGNQSGQNNSHGRGHTDGKYKTSLTDSDGVLKSLTKELRRAGKSNDQSRFGRLWTSRENGNILDVHWDPNPPKRVDSQKDLVQPDEKHLEGVPSFIQHPKPLYYTMKGHPATIECVAEPVSHAVIECAEQVIPYKGPDDSGRLKVTQLDSANRPDPNGKRWHLQLQVRAKEVEEWFDSYVCHCEAWNKVVELQRPKKVVSRETVVIEAYLERKFQLEPVSTDLSVGKRLVLTCIPPKGKPDPEVYWLKDGKRVNSQSFPHILINDYNHLIIENATMIDSGNYTCVAECLGVEYRYANAKVNIFPYPPPPAPPPSLSATDLEQHQVAAASVVPSDSASWTDWSRCSWSTARNPRSESRLCQQTRYRLCAAKVSLAQSPSMVHQTKVDRLAPVATALDCPAPWMQTRNCTPTDCQNLWSGSSQLKDEEKMLPRGLEQSGSLRAKEIAVYVGLFLSLALLLGILAAVIARRRTLKFTTVQAMPYACCFQGKKHQEKGTKITRDLLLTNDFKQTPITFKNPSAVDARQLDENMRSARTASVSNGSQLMISQYNNNLLKELHPQYSSITMYPTYNVQLPGQNLHFANSITSTSATPLLQLPPPPPPPPQPPPPPPPPPPSSLPPIPTNPMLTGPASGASEISGYTGSIPSTQYFLTGMSPAQMIVPPGCVLQTLQASNTVDYMMTPTTYSQIDPLPTYSQRCSIPPRLILYFFASGRFSETKDNRDLEGVLPRLAQTQQTIFNGTVLTPVSTGSSSGQSPANTATTAIGSGNGGGSSSNGSLGLTGPTSLIPVGPIGYGTDISEPEIAAYETHSRPTSGLYHELSLDRSSISDNSQGNNGSVGAKESETIVRGNVTANGGLLCLPASGVYLNVPYGAIRTNTIREVSLSVCREDRNRPSLSDHQTLLSPVVQFGPPDLKLQCPATLSFPHCAALNQSNWLIRLLAVRPLKEAAVHCVVRDGGFENSPDELTSSYNGRNSLRPVSGTRSNQTEVLRWQELCIVGNEHPNLKLIVHLDSSSIHLITDCPNQYCLIGESVNPPLSVGLMPKSMSQTDFMTTVNCATLLETEKGLRGTHEDIKDSSALVPLHNQGAAIKVLRLAAFSGRITPTMDYNIRVYVLSDTKDALEYVCNMESTLDGRLLDSTKPFPFRDNGIGLSFRIEDVSQGWRSRLQTRIQEIPFRHIWSGTQISMLHCAFSLEHVDPTYSNVSCHIVVYQEKSTGGQTQQVVLTINSDSAERQNSFFSKTGQGQRSGIGTEGPICTAPIQPFRLVLFHFMIFSLTLLTAAMLYAVCFVFL